MIVFYHDHCVDGFTCAWLVARTFDLAKSRGDRIIGVQYGKHDRLANVRDAEGEHVFVCDFCFDLETMAGLAAVAERLTVIDHHVTTERKLGLVRERSNVNVVCDVEHCAAMLCWKFLRGETPPPPLLDYIEARDLGRLDRLPDAAAVSAAIDSIPKHFANWSGLFKTSIQDLASAGQVILHWRQTMLDEYLPRATFGATIAGFEGVPVVNVPPAFASEAAERYMAGRPFAAAFYDVGDRRFFALRSERRYGVDVSRVAEAFGGGGHRHAAGFNVRSEGCDFASPIEGLDWPGATPEKRLALENAGKLERKNEDESIMEMAVAPAAGAAVCAQVSTPA